jgi:hypothetical protein
MRCVFADRDRPGRMSFESLTIGQRDKIALPMSRRRDAEFPGDGHPGEYLFYAIAVR